MGFFDKIKQSLTRTKEQLVGRLDEAARRADAPDARSRPIDLDTVEAVRSRKTRGESLRALVRGEILQILRGVENTAPNGHAPHVVMVVGVNGTGKTTTVGKLARLTKDAGKAPLICAADTFRAAAVEQLEVWANRAGVEIIRARTGADPAAVVFDAIAAGKARGR